MDTRVPELACPAPQLQGPYTLRQGYVGALVRVPVFVSGNWSRWGTLLSTDTLTGTGIVRARLRPWGLAGISLPCLLAQAATAAPSRALMAAPSKTRVATCIECGLFALARDETFGAAHGLVNCPDYCYRGALDGQRFWGVGGHACSAPNPPTLTQHRHLSGITATLSTV
jgi:hypothetical protein